MLLFILYFHLKLPYEEDNDVAWRRRVKKVGGGGKGEKSLSDFSNIWNLSDLFYV